MYVRARFKFARNRVHRPDKDRESIAYDLKTVGSLEMHRDYLTLRSFCTNITLAFNITDRRSIARFSESSRLLGYILISVRDSTAIN